MRRRVFVVGGGWCCCYSCCCSWWSCCWGRLAGGKLRPLVARVQHSLGLSHAPIAVAELDDAVRGLELLHVPSRLHRALLQKRDHRQQKSASAPKRLEFPPDAPTTAHDCTNHVAPNLWFHPIGEFRGVLVANTIPPQVHSVCTCSVPPSRAETLAAFSHRAPRSPPKGLGPDGSRPRARTRVYRRLRLHATCSVGLLLAPVTAV